MKHYDAKQVDKIVDDLQYRVVDNAIGVMANQIEGIAAAFTPANVMDGEAIATAFTITDKLVAEIMVRAMGHKDDRHERWLAMHVMGVKRQLAAMAEDREVEHATIEKGLRAALGAREQ